ncbi:MAG: cobalamin biosynthesis protein [Azospirillaceae bacterium]|nr:cobalamin biosynthesis protein [Azospirillaceae bacterium]
MTTLPHAPFAIGIGCASGVLYDDVQELLARAFKRLDWAELPDGLVLATLDSKLEEEALIDAAAILYLPLVGFSDAILRGIGTPTPSAGPEHGRPAVAEAAALAACGAPGNAAARLILPRIQGLVCTCAIACSGETAP